MKSDDELRTDEIFDVEMDWKLIFRKTAFRYYRVVVVGVIFGAISPKM